MFSGEIMGSQSGLKVPVSPVAYAVSFALTGHYAPAALAQTPSADLDAVIVTARKREETLLDIPQEIQTISQEQLQRANLKSVEDFSRFVPSLTVNGTAPGRSGIYFRGVADDSSSFIADSSAAIYLDEQPLTQSALQPEIRLVDIERIEALPGPQGTLYGSSSQSGTLRYITNKPDPSGYYSDIRVDGHSVDQGDEGYEVSGVLNLPAGDNTAIRLVGFSARDAGFIDNVLGESLGGTFDNADVLAKDVNHVEYIGGRAALRWLAGDNWTVDAGIVHQQMDANTYAEDNIERTGRKYTNVRFLDERREDEWTQFALTLQGDLGWGQFTSASSYFTRDISYFQDNTDYTFYLSNAFGPNYVNYDLGPDPRGIGWDDRDRADRYAQEFRLQGETEKSTWIAGLFYEKLDGGFNFLTRVEDYESTPSFQFWNTNYGVEPGTTDNAFYNSNNDQQTEQFAVFGEVSYSPSEDWTLTAGLRWFDHTRTRKYFIESPNGFVTANLPTAKETTSDITKKLSVQYNFSENAMVYALFSDGFRAGGRNVVRPGTVLPPDYEPDFLDNYELGFKSRWAGGRYTLNLTAFRMEWKDYQIEVVDPGPLYAVLVANVGDAEIDGMSLDFTAYLWDSVDFGLNLQLLDGETKADSPQLGLAPGARLPFSADEKGSVWIEYTHPQEIAGGNFYARYQWSYMGNSLNGLPGVELDGSITPANLQPSYQIADAKIGLATDDWDVYVYVDNLTNERAVLFDQQSVPAGNITVNWPRTWGLGFSKSWGGN
ncbi:MAG: TonB-dependent receptor [Gammaproteobacteria bacterium]|nr:TonB-dependent receptor [Gammaproteobacteria bacterium]